MDHLDGGDESATRVPPPAKEATTEENAGIGIVFQIARDGGWYIKKMDPDGAAAECNILQEGDWLCPPPPSHVFSLLGRARQALTRD